MATASADMDPKKPDLEARAEALLERIQRHNRGFDSLTAAEVRSLLECRMDAGDDQSADDLLLSDYVRHPLYVDESSGNNVVGTSVA